MGVSQVPQEQQPATETNGDLEVPGESTVLKHTELLTRWLHASVLNVFDNARQRIVNSRKALKAITPGNEMSTSIIAQPSDKNYVSYLQ